MHVTNPCGWAVTELNKSCYDAVDVNMKCWFRIAVGLLAALAGSPGKAEILPPAKAAADGAYAVRTVMVTDLVSKSRPERRLPVRVHLPAAEGAWPVVILSHGGGGNVDSNYAQAKHLASHGYMVCCLEHVGSNADRLRSKVSLSLRDMTRDREEVLGRPLDVKELLDQIELWNGGHDELWGKFDLEHVAVMGHSFGAYTALVACGARPALDWLERSPVSTLKLDKNFLKSRVESGLGPDLSDPRVDVGIALSPQGPGEPFFLEESFATINRPVLGISGSEDRQPGAPPENRKRFVELTPSAGTLLLWLYGADHTAFSDPSGSGLGAVASESRESVQPVVRASTLYFLDAYLKGRKEELAMLKGQTLLPLAGGRVSSVEVLRRGNIGPAAVKETAKAEDVAEPDESKPLHLRDLLGGPRRKEP